MTLTSIKKKLYTLKQLKTPAVIALIHLKSTLFYSWLKISEFYCTLHTANFTNGIKQFF